MRRPYTEVYVHLVWATWDREPLLEDRAEAAVYACCRAECTELGADVLAIGGIEDHLHLLIRLPMVVPIASLVKQVKGSSSHLLTHEAGYPDFKWQGTYGAFSVEKKRVAMVREYIEHQKEHHAAGSTWPTLEKLSTDD